MFRIGNSQGPKKPILFYVVRTLAYSSSLASMLLFSQPSMAITFSDIENLIKGPPKVDTLEKLIEGLPEELRENYTLMYHSESTQSATPENPRAILFGKDATFVATFNGHSSQRGGGHMEFMEFNESSTQFEFYDVSFCASGVHVSEKNSAKCKVCHGENPHPIQQSINS